MATPRRRRGSGGPRSVGGGARLAARACAAALALLARARLARAALSRLRISSSSHFPCCAQCQCTVRETPRPSLRGAAWRATTPSTHTPLLTRACARFARAAFVRADRRVHARRESPTNATNRLKRWIHWSALPPPHSVRRQHATRRDGDRERALGAARQRGPAAAAARRCGVPRRRRHRSGLAPVVVRKGH